MEIAQSLNFTHGLINAIEPSSPLYKEGAACVSTNSRIDDNGTWNKGPTTTNCTNAPTASTVPGKSGNHFQLISITGVQYIADGLGNSDTLAEGSNGYAYYLASGTLKWWDGTDSTTAVENTNYGTAGLAQPSQSTYPTIAVTGTGARQESGIYFYFATIYNAVRDVESLPTPVVEHWVGKSYVGDIRQADVPVLSGITSTGNRIRWYRSKVIKINKGDTQQLSQITIPTDYYFVGEVATGSTFADYANDTEIVRPENLYKHRGNPAQTSLNSVASFDNRFFTFKSHIVQWSSAGRPEEFPTGYSLRIRHDYSSGVWTTGTFKDQLTKGTAVYTTLAMSPVLESGIEASAIMTVTELVGQTVVRAYEYNGKLWVFTNRTTGYIAPTGTYDAYRYVKVRDDIGVCSPWTLAESPYGLFGADRHGIWVIKGEILQRLSDGLIDITDSAKATYCATANMAASFGVWVDDLNEYWWSVSNVQIVYRADKGFFVGPYQLTLSGGTNYVNGSVAECYLTAGKTPIITSRAGVQTLKFWVGQSNCYSIKSNVKVDVLYTAITAEKSITGAVYLNKIASETGAVSVTGWSHTDSDLLGHLDTRKSGRYIEISLSIPTDCTAPIAVIHYTAFIVSQKERVLR